jgi:hypothetical protein
MSSRDLFMLIFFGTTIYGAFLCIRSLRRIRAPSPYANVILSWYERPLSSYRFERASWLATTSLWTTVGLIGFLTVLQVANPAAPIIFIPEPSPSVVALLFAAAGGSCAYIGLHWGSSTFQPIASALVGRAFYAMSDDGLLYAGLAFPWSSFDRVTYEPHSDVIRLWSAFSPQTTSFSLRPLPPQTATELLEAFRSKLRSTDSDVKGSPLGSFALPGITVAVSLLALLASSALYLWLGWLGLIANAILLHVFRLFTAKLLFKFSSAGKHYRARLKGPAA